MTDTGRPSLLFLGGAGTVTGSKTLLDAGTAYYTAVQTLIPQAVSSESAFTRYYETLVRRPGDPPELVAGNQRLLQTLDWRPSSQNIDRIVGDALAWERKLAAEANAPA